MKKTMILCALTMIANLVFAADQARIDINGQAQQITLQKGDEKNVYYGNGSWLEADQKDKHLMASFEASADEWRDFTFSFTPSKSGVITFILLGQWDETPTNRKFVLFDDITITGNILKNTSFDEMNADNATPKSWIKQKGATEVMKNPDNGTNAVKVHCDAPLIQYMTVEANKKYTVSGKMKLVK